VHPPSESFGGSARIRLCDKQVKATLGRVYAIVLMIVDIGSIAILTGAIA